MKTNKSYTKRLKQTKDGRLLARATKQNHFNAKESGAKKLKKKRLGEFFLTKKLRERFLG
ncbi:MAG: hypothetical protein WD003_01410 [Candidatus Paceibacterota bacterium]